MDPYRWPSTDAQQRPPFTDKPIKEAEENPEQYVDSSSLYPPYLGTGHPARQRSQDPLAPNPPPSATASYHRPTQKLPYVFSAPNPPQYQGTGQQEHPTHFPLGTAPGTHNTWPNPFYGSDLHSDIYGPASGGDVPTGHNLYTRGLPFQGPLLESQDPGQQGLRDEPFQPDSRRATVTQRSHDAIARRTQQYPPSTPTHASHYQERTRRSRMDVYQDHHTSPNQEIDDQPLADARNLARQQQQAPYQQGSFPGFDSSSMQAPQGQYFQPIHGPSRQLAGPSFAPVLSGEMESAQVSPEAIRPPNPRNRQVGPPRVRSPVTPSTLPRSRHPDRPDRSESPPTTPAGTEGSNDPEQEEDDPTPSTSLASSTSTLTPSPTTVRWARFNVPDNVFLNPPDPVRHQLYHQIRQEPWFLNQTQERPITGDEASRLPGLFPGESVLLAFYDRVPDAQSNRTVMRCTICMQTNQNAHLYPRPDRARVHMRHHFELRPVPCNGQCNIRHCRQRFFTNGDLNAHVAGKTELLVKCEYCAKPLRSKNLQRHINQFCHRIPPGVRRESPGQEGVFNVPQTKPSPQRLLASLTFPSQQSRTTLVNKEEETTDTRLGGRVIRLVIYGRISSEDVHKAWFHRQAKFGNVIEGLSTVYQIRATERVVILGADWGAKPCWNEADPDSFIGEACQVLYVVFKRQFIRYILAVVRDSLTDFPVCISILANSSSKTISECVTASHPELFGRIRSITDYTSDDDLSDAQIESARIEAFFSSKLRTTITITLDKSPAKFTTELSYKPVPALLQVPFLYCEHLMQRAYALDTFALQMIHITGATRHLIISLANEMKTVFADERSGDDAVLTAEGDLADLLQVAPLLSDELETVLDQISRVIDQLGEDRLSRQETQKKINAIFTSLCGEFPGAVTIRHSDKLFKRLGSIDHQENQALDRHDATSPEIIHRDVSNGHENASGSRYGQDADHEMADSGSVGRSLTRRRGRTRIGENDEDMVVDLDGSERESE